MEAERCFGGIDFSGAREPLANLWSAVGIQVDGGLTIVDLRPHAYRVDLGGFVREGWRAVAPSANAITWGVDFPFGLAQESALAFGVTSWPALLAWVADRPADEVKEACGGTIRGMRGTDTGGALAPLDLRLYKQTVEGLRWLHELREEHGVSVLPQDATPSEVTLIETYPSGAVRDLGLPRRRAPGRPGEIRARAASLRPFLDFSNPQLEATAVTLEDAWDAVIACLCAFLCRDDLDQPSRVEPTGTARIQLEGWIYRPPAALV